MSEREVSVRGAAERSLEFDDPKLARELFGPGNDNLALVSAKSGAGIDSRGLKLVLRAADPAQIDLAANLLLQMYGLLKDGYPVYKSDIEYGLRILMREPGAKLKKIFQDAVFVSTGKRIIAPKTLSQKEYVHAMRSCDMVFAIGPAGTGKTYLAVAMALASLQAREVKRLVLCRPAVEAGERLGFLPGDMMEKVNPYLRPLYDALHDMLDFRRVREMIDGDIIEIAPLAFMRGRTLNDAFIILDEAQNTTPEQMKMLLTRLGFGSRVVITGDITQIDLPAIRYAGGEDNGRAPGSPASRSGLVQAEKVLADVEGLRFIHFHEQDVIRHHLVARIVHAYERYDNGRKEEH